MDASTQQKQRFLREEILESSYDADQFVNFLCKDLEIKELDVQNHTMKDLQSIVLKFKQYKYYHQQERPKRVKKAKIDYQNNGSVYDYEFSQVHECIRLQELASQMQVFIPKFQITQTEGIFFSIGSKTSIWFIIKSNLNKQPVKRLEEDFQWLSNILSKLHPTIAFPQLITVAKEFYDNHEKRRRQLQEFVQILSKREELRCSKLYYDFLTLPYDKLQKFKKHSDTLAFVKGIQNIQNLSGRAQVALSNNLREYVQQIPIYNRKTQTLHENIASSIERTLQLYNSAHAEINKIVNYFAQIHQSYNLISSKHPQSKINEYSEILININNLFHSFSDNLLTTSRVIETNFKEYHKITLNYDKSIGKLYKNVFQAEKDYVNFKLNLNRKKERIYPDVSKWQADEKLIQNRRLTMEETFDLMLPKETEQQFKIKNWMAFLYGNCKKQFERQINFQLKRYVGVSCTFCSQILLNNKNFVEQITKFIEQSHKICATQ